MFSDHSVRRLLMVYLSGGGGVRLAMRSSVWSPHGMRDIRWFSFKDRVTIQRARLLLIDEHSHGDTVQFPE
ncbi:MAG: hypothetical protein ABIH23_11315 [bacterium]